MFYLQVVVVKVENPEVGQACEGGGLHWLDPVLSQVQLLHAGEAAEDLGGKFLQEVLPQWEDCDSFQTVKGWVRHSEYLIVGQPQLYQLLLLDEASVRQTDQLVVAQVHVLQLGVEPEGRVHSPGVRCRQARLSLVQLICTALSLVESFKVLKYLLHQPSYAIKNHREAKMPLVGGFGCLELCLYGIRKGWFPCSLALSLPDVVVLQL